mgnify:FL=1|jgi:hypothetical protein|tara:strand:- start:68 stop:520 length:453 start_codon:yes stop_codon:yes gene_type:complete
MINYTKIAGMGEYRKKKKPKVKTKKDKPSRKVKTKTGEKFRIKEVNPFTKAVSVKEKKRKVMENPTTYAVEPGNINRPGPTGLTVRRNTGLAVDKKSGFTRSKKGSVADKEIREVAEALKDKKAGGGKVGNKYFTGGMVNPSYGTEFDDR